MNQQAAPKVFVSHASEDKARFVLGFAEKLRSHGVDAWLDKWEMKPGDSLIDKIFEEGIKEASVFIIVLSSNSVSKPWVRQELDVAAVKRIEGGTKLIPVVIDDCEVPEVLKSTLWEKIPDLQNYEPSLDRILSAVFNLDERPPLGPLPPYAGKSIAQVGSLNALDSLIMQLSCEAMLEQGNVFLNPVEVFDLDGTPKVPAHELKDSLEILDSYGSVEVLKALGGGLRPYRVTEPGFELYARSCIEDYDSLTGEVMNLIVNREMRSNQEIAQAVERPIYLINHIFWVMEQHGFVKYSKSLGEARRIYDVGVSLRRQVRERSL